MTSKKKPDVVKSSAPTKKFLVLDVNGSSFFSDDMNFDEPKYFTSIDDALEAIKNSYRDEEYVSINDVFRIVEVSDVYYVKSETSPSAKRVD